MFGPLMKLLAYSILLIDALCSLKPSIQGKAKEHRGKHDQQIPERQQSELPSINPAIAQPSCKDEQWHNEQKTYWDRQIRIGYLLNWITGIAAGIAFLALIPLYIQMQSAQNALKVTERAWVIVKGITLEDFMVAGQEPVAIAGFYNSGHTPALQVSVHHFQRIVPSLAPKDKPDFRRIAGESVTVVGPDSKVTSKQKYMSVTMEEMSNMAAGRAYLYNYGIIQYMDIFGIDHWTMFCYRSRDLTDRNLVACSEWNETDKN